MLDGRDGSLADMAQDEVRSICDPDLGQHDRFVSEFTIGDHEPVVLGDRFGQTVLSLTVVHVDFGPRRRQEDAPMVALVKCQHVSRRVSCRVLKRHRGVHQTTVEEDPAGLVTHALPILGGKVDRSSGEGG